MIIDLDPEPFLDKLAQVAATSASPVRVEIQRQPVPVFIAVGGRTQPRDAVLVVYRFRDGGDEFLAREHAIFNEFGEADLNTLLVWPELRRLGVTGAAPANDGPPREDLRNVRPALMHRSGSV